MTDNTAASTTLYSFTFTAFITSSRSNSRRQWYRQRTQVNHSKSTNLSPSAVSTAVHWAERHRTSVELSWVAAVSGVEVTCGSLTSTWDWCMTSIDHPSCIPTHRIHTLTATHSWTCWRESPIYSVSQKKSPPKGSWHFSFFSQTVENF